MRLSSKFSTGRHGIVAAEASEDRIEQHPGREAPAPSPAAKNLALAHHIERLIEREVIADYTEAARMLGVSQPRMTHLMGLLLLAPAIQESILMGGVAPKDKELRGLARHPDWQTQESSI